jgi:hypothetical protein
MTTKNIRADSVFSDLSANGLRFSGSTDMVDFAGQGALDLVHRAASSARESNKQALNAVHELSIKLQSANNRIQELEGKVAQYQTRMERAEKWFGAISDELRRQFFEPADNRAEQTRNSFIRMASSRAEDESDS